jgi:hypothetical protein
LPAEVLAAKPWRLPHQWSPPSSTSFPRKPMALNWSGSSSCRSMIPWWPCTGTKRQVNCIFTSVNPPPFPSSRLFRPHPHTHTILAAGFFPPVEQDGSGGPLQAQEEREIFFNSSPVLVFFLPSLAPHPQTLMYGKYIFPFRFVWVLAQFCAGV